MAVLYESTLYRALKTNYAAKAATRMSFTQNLRIGRVEFLYLMFW